ncbi:NRDE family protein [Ureibacillus sp. FSL K6-8385]|uniref:NRDE family protein n=1 Tax=Ureibacillus terrenus TaxID=118246 RepID=A0A540V5X4_9BACL|nr:NRDE family protein [Ureibacillus terrenus]MED3660862.1 NRDE family protein [Ureibacillus terrenus]MED3764639.1 NRDE family protein [Ureibacillus terrenus]TQE92156.1 NRDE family protein [Ureibacillus terrenus]
MCLIHLHFKNHPMYQLIIAANRDEVYDRPTEPAHFWEDEPGILAGRDLLEMGTWMGVSKNGRFAAITNFRDPSLPKKPRSRGEIVRNFLKSSVHPKEFIDELAKEKDSYGGFNVIVGDPEQLFHYNNILDEKNEIKPGTHSISNHTLNTPWPKVVKGKARFADYIQRNLGKLDIEKLFEIMMDREIAPDEQLPDTGVGLEMERKLSPAFIQLPHYGTRCSTVLLIDHEQNVTFVERTFNSGNLKFEKRFHFKIEE